MSPRATRPPKEGPAQPSTRRRPSLPARGRKAAAANGASPAPASTVEPAAETPREPISWIEMAQPAASVPHIAMPKLTGQPAYARPPRPLAIETPRPLDPDDLPIEAFRSEEDQQVAARLASGANHDEGHGAALDPSSVGGLRGIAGRLLGRG